MKYNIKIGDRTFEAAIEDINKRPIVVVVNGQEFLVSPEPSALEIESAAMLEVPGKPVLPLGSSLDESVLLSPLPGTVIQVFVKPGEKVQPGQVLLIIEAMKMKNSIRSTHDGMVAAVLVSAGQTVAHKQSLVEFEK